MRSDRLVGARVLVLVSFVTLTLGFVAGYWMKGVGQERGQDAGAPHAVGVEEYVRLGMSSLAAGDYQEAERMFREAVAVDGDNPGPRVDLAMALMSQGRWGEADRELAEAKRIAPSMPAVWYLEGWVARDGFADTARARAAWERFLELAPADTPQAAEVRRWLEGGESRPEAGADAGPAEEAPSGG